jgi:hypothetical protein
MGDLRGGLSSPRLTNPSPARYEAPTKDNLKKARLHLTNFAVNKTSKNFVAGEHGTKRSLKAVLAQLVNASP